MDLTQRSLNNSAYSFLGYTLPIVFSIAITPILVGKLGSGEFGVYVLANTVMGFLNLVDFGVGQAFLKHLSEHIHPEHVDQRTKIFEAGNFMFWIIGIFGLGVLGLLALLFLPSFQIVGSAIPNARIVFFLTGILFFINSLTNIQHNALKAAQRYDITVKISLSYITFFNISVLAAVVLGYQLKAVVACNIVSSAGALLALRYYVGKHYPGIRSLYPRFHGLEIRKFYRFGGAVFVTNIANNTLAQFDRLFIPYYLNPTQLAYYSLPGSVAEKINGTVGTSTGFLFPVLSSLSAAGQKERTVTIYERVIRNAWVFASAMVITVALFSEKILHYWLGENFAQNGTRVLIILAVTNGILAMYSVLQNMLLGMDKVRFLMKQSVGMAAINVALLIWLLPAYGIQGAAWAYLLSVLPVFGILGWVEKRFFGLTGREKFYLGLFVKLGTVSAITAALFYGIVSDRVTSLAGLIIAGPFIFLFYLSAYGAFGFLEDEDVRAYMVLVRGVAGRIARIFRLANR